MPLREVGVRHRLGARRDRLDDVLVAGAAAEIAFEFLADGVVAEVVALAVDDVDRGHDHAGGAEAALQAVMLAERLLHRMQRRAVGGQTFDGLDLVPVSHYRERGAGLDRLAVEMHDAGTALRGVAADMGAGQPKIFAQKLHQQGAGVDIGVDGIAVHDQGNLGHSALSSSVLLHCTAAQSLKPFQSHNMGHPSNEQPHLGHSPTWLGATWPRAWPATWPETWPGTWPGTWPRLALHRLGEIRKKLIGQFLGRTVDQPLPELGELAADLRLDVIGQQRTAILVGQSYRRAALAEPADSALALARYLVAIGRIEITERDPALEAGRHRSDLH